MTRLVDIHDEEPGIPLLIEDAGILNLRIKPLRTSNYWLIPTLSASIELSRHKRGVHISRIARLVLETFNDEYFDYNLIDSLAEKLLDTHSETNRARVVLKARVAGSESNQSILYCVVAHRNGIDKRISGSGVTVLNACPCALNVSTTIFGKPYTHMQKTRIKTLIVTRNFVNPLELGLIIEKTFTTMKNVLNRLDEYRMIAQLYDKPLFNEDIVRLTAKLVYENYRDRLRENDKLRISVVSYETIHTFRVYSKLSRRICELDEELALSNNSRK
ncbi:MAG: GTP cyclohydrolase, FolE2/MptA family [Desulfurococcaceae archaeon]